MIQGTGLGSLLGAGAGYSLGGSRGAIAGALISGMSGNQFGQHVAMKKALAQTSDANLDAAIKESLTEDAAARKRTSLLRHDLMNYRSRISAARAKNDTRELARIKGELKVLNQQVGSEVASRDKSIGMQRQLVAKLPSTNTRYAKLNDALQQNTASRNNLASVQQLLASINLQDGGDSPSRNLPPDLPPTRGAASQDVPDPDVLSKSQKF